MTRISSILAWRERRLDTPLVLSLLVLALAAAIAVSGTAAMQRTACEVLIRLVAVVGMYVFIGNSGVISFGHIAFLGVGAYAAAWMTMEPGIKQQLLTGLPTWLGEASLHWLPASLLAGVLAAGVALVAGAMILRLAGIAASIATFALLAIFNVVYSNWDSVTAGTSSIVGIPTAVGLWQACLLALAAIWLAHLYSQSRFGLALRSVREEPVASRACGVNAWRQGLVAFVISAALCGVAGALDAQFLGVVSPDAYYLDRTFLCLAMLVVGGMGTLTGAVTGVLLLSIVKELLNQLESGVTLLGLGIKLPAGAQEIAIGLLMMAVLVWRPGGLLGTREWGWPGRRGARGGEGAVPLARAA
ncbi:branched-chain amino acid ABC transporter permease [Ottowia sp.]|uniref:branched-chain amino acid ABC transporter permease n=1 Tax=Ottowia sp. TaxID=1898956 RepID=UPI002B5A203A|nr:branched-chain amino acid ABC transporter permease [Ottowia sp.]HOB67703.1 branched-chain amino acid ABC transporter permease [Ottowia sp.]HPZ58340.1 branched-chain amino acid ABC transporter permease [Ottowia sp.]HQD48583.1 branched-chain amino acid ABC transporter permease [Ottowia sp.]